MKLQMLLVASILALTGCSPSVQPVQPAPASTATPAIRVGARGVVSLPDPSTPYPAAIDRATYALLERAMNDRDSRPLDRAIRNGDTVPLTHGTPVEIVAVGDAIQIEVSDGPLKGRRAWVPRGVLKL